MLAGEPFNPARMKFAKPVLLPQAIGHHTPAVRTLFGLATGAARSLLGGRRRKKKVSSRLHRKARRHRKVHRKKRAVRAHHRGHRAAHLVKGSAAARRHMAKIRRAGKRKLSGG